MFVPTESTIPCAQRIGRYCWARVSECARSSTRCIEQSRDDPPTWRAILSSLPTTEAEAEAVQCLALVGLPCPNAQQRPHYDRELRVLSLGGKVVKRFREPAANQELVLAAFEELGWPERIDDPIPPHDGVDPRECLHSTIERLNRNQFCNGIKFSGDGTGKGVSWEATAEAPLRKRTKRRVGSRAGSPYRAPTERL